MFKISKDKLIGLLVAILGVVIGIVYTLGSIVDLYLETLGGNPTHGFFIPIFGMDLFDWRLFVVLPLWILVILVCIIAIWIGYSMLTTPAPVPLEELEAELEMEEEVEVEEEEEETEEAK